VRDKTAIVGIGQTEFSKSIGRPEKRIALEAIGAALDDAGLAPEDVDGLVRFDIESSTEVEIARNLGIPNLRFYGEVGYGGGGGCAAVFHAAMAVATGAADVVVCWRARNRGSGGRPWAKTGWRVGGDGQFFLPFGLVRPVDQVAMIARRYAHEYAAPPEMLGAVALACRKHATRNPAALMREPMSMDDYRSARMVADPLRLFDCCLETDGALAAVVTSSERARDLKQRPAYILAGAQGTGPQCVVMANYHKADFLETTSPYCARELFGRAGVTAKDVDVAQIYDAFTPLVVLSLEEYGFCARGEAKDFVEDGALEWPHGRLPINTSGGSLSEAYVRHVDVRREGRRDLSGDERRRGADERSAPREPQLMADERGMIAARPLPEPDEWSKGFWDACAAGRLEMQRCAACRGFRFPPRPMCPHCRSLDWEYARVSGRGAIYSWIVVHPPVMPAFRDRVPLPVVLVELEEDAQLRMVGNLLGCAPERIAMGMPVEVAFEKVADDVTLPQWRPRAVES
jgi:acetyl-CoA acetyltransferase/uncharacterized OB-fold protein